MAIRSRIGWRLWVLTALVLFTALPILLIDLPGYNNAFDKIMAFVMLTSIGSLHLLDSVYPFIRRQFNKRYQATVTIHRREKNWAWASDAFAEYAHHYYSGRLYQYPIAQYVYVIKDISASGYYKIGKTNCPSRRLHRFEITLPFSVRIVAIIPCEDMTRLEAALHQRFALKRVSGEWFNLSGDDLEAILPLEIKILD